MKNIIALEPVNGRKSFYNKCTVIKEKTISKLQSYTTIVATYNHETKNLVVNGWYSATTERHLNAFFVHCGLPTLNKKEIIEISSK